MTKQRVAARPLPLPNGDRPAPDALEPEDFHAPVLAWFDRHGRKDLPWQGNAGPYAVWVSEIMLQQTQVATVIPYFQKFMARWPTVAILAAAPVEAVLGLWAGLGYYARARHLHRAAGVLMERHGGEFPAERDALMALPGVGRSTAGAILSLGLGRPGTILDGNVRRVLCRHAGIEGWPGHGRVAAELWRLAEVLTPAERVADYNQAMMDLGAMVCLPRNPACAACPLHAGCAARRRGLTKVIPGKKPAKTLPTRSCRMLVLYRESGEVYLERRPPVGIWGGLLSLPEFADAETLHAWCELRGIEPARLESLPARRHTFSHFHLEFVPVLLKVPAPMTGVAESAGAWYRPGQAEGLPAPIQRLLLDLGPVPFGGR